MPLPAAWVNALFDRLTVRYGESFQRQYGKLDPELVKADWAQVLDGMRDHPEAIAWALDHLPADYPPTALRFRDLCRAAPRHEAPALAAPVASREVVHAAIARINASVASISDTSRWGPKDTIARLEAIEASGRTLTAAQRSILRELRALVAPVAPINQDELPPRISLPSESGAHA